MKKAVLIFFLFFACLACNKQEGQPVPRPEREPSMPEKVEKEMREVLGKDWKSLSDTVQYFNTNLLRKGKTRGKGPDKVYYELDFRMLSINEFESVFTVEDSIMAAVNGKLKPTQLSLTALNTVLDMNKEKKDSIGVAVSNVKVIAPLRFFLDKDHRAALLFEGERVGWLTREDFENTDYSTGTYIVIHYYGDNRSFALFDNGLGEFLGNNLDYVFN